MSRVLLLDADKPLDVFDVVELTDRLARVRSAFLFEVGEELRLQLEINGKVTAAQARVRAHTGPSDDKVTELELVEPDSPASARSLHLGPDESR